MNGRGRNALLLVLAFVALFLIFQGRKSSFSPAPAPGSGRMRRAPAGFPEFYFVNAGEECDAGYKKDPQRPLACIKSI